MASNFDQPLFNWEASDTFQEFQRFRQHVNFTFKGPLCKSDAKDKAGWIGLWIGQQGREIYKTLTWDEGEEDAPDKILDKLEAYVRPRKNKRVARFRAQQRKQSHGESFDNFVKDLRIILMDCEFADPDDMLIDLIINGMSHAKVQERLLDQGQGLTLSKAIDIGRQYEMSQSQMKLIRGDGTLPVSSVRGKPTTKSRCGREAHQGNATCPAKGTVCKFCKKRDHWTIVCRKRLSEQVNKVDTWDEDHGAHSDNEIMHVCATDCLSACESTHNVSESAVMGVQIDKWTENLNICGKSVKFRIDTGAKCCIIVKSEFDILNVPKPLTQPSSKVLRSYSNHDIRPLYFVVLKVTNGNFARDVAFEVVNINQENVISGDVAEQLGLRGVKHLPQFHSGDFVRLQPQTGTKSWRPGTIVESHSPRSYMVDNGDSVVRRNRSHIRKSTEKANFTLPEPDINVNDSVESKPQPFGFPCSGGESVIVENARETGYVTKSGRVVKPPRKLDL
ncbi:hypothetical protein KUTeg_017354 [Tegillarca granosa]|uniref:Uncharacterized protein n=1 Tax=Tegillarca granosa TaxID=220873 RepID=A0ABQ9EIJ1_TEGGR|nr:hypothetical protein KUTeg_017354 [Tegillarca granosa]